MCSSYYVTGAVILQCMRARRVAAHSNLRWQGSENMHSTSDVPFTIFLIDHKACHHSVCAESRLTYDYLYARLPTKKSVVRTRHRCRQVGAAHIRRVAELRRPGSCASVLLCAPRIAHKGHTSPETFKHLYVTPALRYPGKTAPCSASVEHCAV
jgi:hypothetical protein